MKRHGAADSTGDVTAYTMYRLHWPQLSVKIVAVEVAVSVDTNVDYPHQAPHCFYGTVKVNNNFHNNFGKYIKFPGCYFLNLLCFGWFCLVFI